MKLQTRYLAILIFLILTLVGHQPASASPPSAPAFSGAEVIAAINQYRQQNGLPALTTNSLLNSLAQSQSEYQASISTITHTGPGGTTPQERADAAGYGGGSFFYLSEIIYGGTSATVSSAMTWWKNSSLHNGIMLDSRYTEIGAGVATDGSFTYFTAELGGPTNSGIVLPTSSGTEPGDGSTLPTQEAPVTIPVQVATPRADGSLYHIVQPGQSLWTISAVYGVELETLRELNDLGVYAYLQPGDEILVQENVPTSTPPPASPTPEPTQTPPGLEAEIPSENLPVLGTPFTVFLEATPAPETATPLPTAAATEEQPPQKGLFPSNPTVSTLVISALVILLGVIIASLFIRPSEERPPRDPLLD